MSRFEEKMRSFCKHIFNLLEWTMMKSFIIIKILMGIFACKRYYIIRVFYHTNNEYLLLSFKQPACTTGTTQ